MLLPIRTDRPRIRPAYLTLVLMAICIAVQIAARVWGEVEVEEDVWAPRMIVFFGLWGDRPGDWVKWLTHMFVHGDELHLAGNMLFLWVFGSVLEDVLRPWGLLALYVIGGLIAAATQLTVGSLSGADMHLPMVGASGAIAAIMGLFMVRFYRTQVEIFIWFHYSVWVQAVWALAVWAALQLFEGMLATQTGDYSVAYWCHLGGFLTGAAVAPFIGGASGARKEFVTSDPDTNVEYVRRGEIVEKAQKALSADPGNAYLMRKLAQVQRYAGDYEDATATYQRAVYRFATRGMMDQAAEVYVELLSHNDTAVLPPEIQLKLAQHMEPTRLAQAVRSYQVLALNHPTRPEGEHALLRLAALYQHSLGQPQEALRCLYDFLQRYPHSEWAPEARQTYELLHLQHGPARR